MSMEIEDHNGVLDLSQPPPPQPVGIYGWRKRCLYAFVLVLMVVVIMNLALTVWILRVLDFSLDGMGQLRIVPKGFELRGEAEFLKTVYVNKLKSESGKSLYFQSNKAVEILSTDKGKKRKSHMILDQENVTVTCDTFRIQDTNGTVNFMLSQDKVLLGSGDVSVQGKVKFEGSVSTPTVHSPLDSSLEISSENSMVQIRGTGGIDISSALGNITIDAADQIYLSTGTLKFNGKDIYLTGIPTVDANSSSTTPAPNVTVFPLCVCENGRTFLGLASGNCTTSFDICSPPVP
ncbi:unnamed protein product [Lymnaea stagnalis]|uniref:Zeta-sarcoglycan n=1 Tax=Lymnaea stagnalis TaxID=6523 RepID=A0AAV2HW04_LYMST